MDDQKTENKYDYILQLCVDKDNFNKEFRTPFYVEQQVYGTDQVLCVRVPSALAGLSYPEGNPATADTISNLISKDESFEVINLQTEKLFGMLAHLEPRIDLYKKCSKCHGVGESDCFHCGNTMECETCYGEGYSGGKELFRVIFGERSIMFKDHKFQAQYINTIAVAALLSDTKEIDIELRKDKAIFVLSNGVRFLLMCLSR